MKNKDVMSLYKSLVELSGLKGVKLAYAVARNKVILQNEFEGLVASQKESQEFLDFEDERVELAKKYSKKNADSEPETKIVNKTREYILEDKEAFKKALAELKEKYKKTLDERDQQIKDFEALLEEESKITLHKVSMADIPQDITVDQMDVILNFLDKE